jgi:hypothetical protein
MTIFGKPLSEYVAFSKVFLGLILVVGIARLALSLAGVPNSTAKWFSISAVIWIGVLYYAIRVHTSGFGSYKQLLPIVFLMQAVVAQPIIVAAIVLAIFTGADNIYSAPEYSFGSDGKTWLHVGAHLVLGTTIGTLVFWLVGCVVMFATRKLTRGKDTQVTARA